LFKQQIQKIFIEHKSTSLLAFFSALASNFARFLAPNFGSIAAITLGSTVASSFSAFSFLGSECSIL